MGIKLIKEPRNKELDDQLYQFQNISLEEINQAALMKRIDQKFLLNKQQLFQILPEMRQHYSVLAIDGIVNHYYSSAYFDTPELDMYMKHHNQRRNRHKIRQRIYHTNNEGFLEVKHKNNKGYTKKTRIATDRRLKYLTPDYAEFILAHTPYQPFKLRKVMENDFFRFTLTNAARNQRITIDTDVSFYLEKQSLHLNNLVIAEVKSDKTNMDRTILQLFKENGIRPSGMSKYSIGLAMLKPDLKQNLFKQKMNTLNKLRHAV